MKKSVAIYLLIVLLSVGWFWYYVWKLTDGRQVMQVQHYFFNSIALVMLCFFPAILGIVIAIVSTSSILGAIVGLLVYAVQRVLYQPALLNVRCQPNPTVTSSFLPKLAKKWRGGLYQETTPPSGN